MSEAKGRCAWCGKEGSRWAQFPFCHARACDECMKKHGGWRREDGKPLAHAFPKEDT